jgi:hypothetical protein
VIESDDWGACETSRNAADAAALALVRRDRGLPEDGVWRTLESPADLARLYAVLARFAGADGVPPVFTAFVCVGNPDFAAVAEAGFDTYHDVGIARGVPAGWERGDVPGAWRDGMCRGVFAPEFHANLHHTSPGLWLALLREESADGAAARAAFDVASYDQGRHLPEYAGMNVREQDEWVRTGVDRFVAATGISPAAAVTSDAYPMTETVWALRGIRIVCLKNCRINSGEVVVYHTKPWNNQDVFTPIGAYNAATDVVYLTRNVFFECTVAGGGTAAEALAVAQARWGEGEPAVISTHRLHYVSLAAGVVDRGLAQLAELLDGLTAAGACFLTSAELGDIYRQGWSLRAFGDRRLLRVWSATHDPIRVAAAAAHVRSLTGGVGGTVLRDGQASVIEAPLGTYWLEV